VSSGPAPFATPPTLAPAQATSQVDSLLCTLSSNGAGAFPPAVQPGAGGGTGAGAGTQGTLASSPGLGSATPNTAAGQAGACTALAAVLGAAGLAAIGRRARGAADPTAGNQRGGSP
jgi:hypothetical protein